MTRYAKIAVGAAVIAIAGGGAYYARMVREIPVRVAVVERDVEVRVFGIGTVEAQVLSKVGFQVGGKIASVHADQGDLVKAGALLAKAARNWPSNWKRRDTTGLLRQWA